MNRFTRSKARWPMVFTILILGFALVLGLNFFKSQGQKVTPPPSDLKIYYDKVLDMNKALKQAESDFDKGAGGTPIVSDYADRTSLTNQKRFVRACDRILLQVEGQLFDVYAMADSVPLGAESHYVKLRTKLEERQRFYARLKDSVDKKIEDRWKDAFANYNLMRDAATAEEQALNNLQTMVLRPTPAGSR